VVTNLIAVNDQKTENETLKNRENHLYNQLIAKGPINRVRTFVARGW